MIMKENLVETIEYRGYDIDCYYDTDSESPDDWGNDDVFIVHDHRQFSVKRKGFDPEDIYERMQEGKKLYPHDEYWFFPVYAYIHSGVSLSLGRWFPGLPQGHNEFDVSFKGFMLVQRKKKWSWTEDQAYKVAQSEVNTWNEYLSGDVYGYNSECGSCWSFYGEEGYKRMIEDAKAEIDYEIKKLRKKHFAHLKTMIRNRVPYEKRTCLAI